ncbi:MAG: DUF3990 domain-containing protein [Dysgonamonadaceae bacterium]|jgi:hypothetical protein|nr:DUF3990 domain-containing protein [Dysgonamonadaceae bacterium]
MRVFHGSDVRIEKIDLTKGGEFKDFGRGFYVTNIRKHAHQRAIDIAALHGTKPVVTEFEFMEAYPVTMRMAMKSFDTVSEEWVQFVILNRNRTVNHPAHAYQIVEGPIANDWVTTQIDRYRKGKITLTELVDRLQYREPTHQICFCTVESLMALELVEDTALFDIEDISNKIIESLISEYEIKESEALHYLYNSNIYTELTNPDTGIYTHSWEDIYHLLLEEIKDKFK